MVKDFLWIYSGKLICNRIRFSIKRRLTSLPGHLTAFGLQIVKTPLIRQKQGEKMLLVDKLPRDSADFVILFP